MTGENDQEPIGPGSNEYKDKVTAGTSGVQTGYNEYELNLEVALRLKCTLENRGYLVVMTRDKHDVSISNKERAEMANAAEADVFIRIHANGDSDGSKKGAFTINQTSTSPFNSDIYSECRLLSECILDEYCEETNIPKLPIWETNTMTGINWSMVPVTIIEMGFMSNIEEDKLMSQESFWWSAALGIANGIDLYFETLEG